MTTYLIALLCGITAAIGIFGALGLLLLPGFFERMRARLPKSLGLAMVLGWAVVCMAAVTQIDLTTQVKNLLPVANGGIGIGSGTSGGILGFTASGTIASSSALATNALVVGQGAGSTPIAKSWADMDSAQYAAGGGTATTMTVTLPQAATSLVNGLEINFLPAAANTGAAPTLAVNGLAAKPITKLGATALVAGDMTTTAIASVIYDGTEFQLQNPQTSSAAPNQNQGAPSGTINGVNTTFTLSPTPAASSNVNCFLNGVQQQQGAGNDYTISGATITYLTAPATGAKLNCLWY